MQHFNEISAAAHLIEQDNSASLTHGSLQDFLVLLCMKIPIKMCTVSVHLFIFFFTKELNGSGCPLISLAPPVT